MINIKYENFNIQKYVKKIVTFKIKNCEKASLYH